MSYKDKTMITDALDRPIPQWYNPATDNYEPLPELATQDELKKLNESIKNINISGNDTVMEEPPQVKNIKFLDPVLASIRVKWFSEGLFYGTNAGRGIFKSVDGENWEKVTDVPVSHTTPIEIFMVSETGRMVAGFFNGEVYVSDEEGVFSEAPTFTTGRLLVRRGNFMYRNIIGINSYAPHGMDQQHEFWLSTDNGETFEKVFDNSNVGTLPDPDRFHFHDCEYDPYSGRLFIWIGDFDNRNMFYSDDWGVSWNKVWDTFSPGNVTQIHATSKGLALGSDTNPGGIQYLEIDRRGGAINPPVLSDNYDDDFFHFSPGRYIAGRRWVDRETGIHLMPFYSEHDNGIGRLAISRDGYNWHELFKDRSIGFHHGFDLVTVGNGKIVARYIRGTSYSRNFVADLVL